MVTSILYPLACVYKCGIYSEIVCISTSRSFHWGIILIAEQSVFPGGSFNASEVICCTTTRKHVHPSRHSQLTRNATLSSTLAAASQSLRYQFVFGNFFLRWFQFRFPAYPVNIQRRFQLSTLHLHFINFILIKLIALKLNACGGLCCDILDFFPHLFDAVFIPDFLSSACVWLYVCVN